MIFLFLGVGDLFAFHMKSSPIPFLSFFYKRIFFFQKILPRMIQGQISISDWQLLYKVLYRVADILNFSTRLTQFATRESPYNYLFIISIE